MGIISCAMQYIPIAYLFYLWKIVSVNSILLIFPPLPFSLYLLFCFCFIHIFICILFLDFTYKWYPKWHNGKESTCWCRRCRCGFDPWVKKISYSRKWQPTPVFLPREFRGQRSLVWFSPWVCKESDMAEQLSTSMYKWHHTIFIFLCFPYFTKYNIL